MKTYFQKSLFLVSVTFIIMLLNGPGGVAGSVGEPIVIRKKIDVRNYSNSHSASVNDAKSEHRKQTPSPKSDIAELQNENKVDTDYAKIRSAASKITRRKIKPYDAASKIDPFKPLFISKSNKKEDNAAPTYVVVEQRDKGPLENFELNQLKLTGIIRTTDKNIALVQEASGRGYVIQKGTRIGTKGGKVADILKDRIIVGEKMRDIKGNICIQKIELKLNKKI